MIKVAGIGLVQVALVNERLNHLTRHQNPRHEDAMAVPALALFVGNGDVAGHGSGQPGLAIGPIAARRHVIFELRISDFAEVLEPALAN